MNFSPSGKLLSTSGDGFGLGWYGKRREQGGEIERSSSRAGIVLSIGPGDQPVLLRQFDMAGKAGADTLDGIA